jgi:hypothetical protein
MTPERMAKLVAAWVRLYTRRLPAAIARRRVEEIDADLHDHIAHERARGTSDGRIAVGILSRMIRGLAADASWRRRHSKPAARATVGVVLTAVFVLMLPLLSRRGRRAMSRTGPPPASR